MPINAHPEYIAAEGEYLKAQSLDEKIDKLKKMISFAPAHKGGENLRAQLKTRLKKLLEQQEKNKKSGKSQRPGKDNIKKEDMQAVLIGKTNSGKSSLLNILTNTNRKISELKFTTTKPEIAMMNYNTVQIQIIDLPSLDSDYYDKGIAYTADTVVLVANSIEDIRTLLETVKTKGKIIIAFNKSDNFSETEKRKIFATLKSKFKQYPSVMISSKNSTGIDELKELIFKSFDIIRIYTKEPGKEFSKSKEKPIILQPGSIVRDVAEKIFKGFSNKIKEAKIWGPSSKFPGQVIGLKHKVKDMDIIEFKTK